MEGRFFFLGTGASTGIPVIGCHCSVCASRDAHNRRLRASGLIEIGGKKLVIDAGPDFRQQALLHQIDHLDVLFLTHSHYDHIGGIDEMRAYYFLGKKPVPCFSFPECLDEIKKRFGYLFDPANDMKGSPLAFHVLDTDYGTLDIEGIRVGFFSFRQGGMKVAGYRFGNFAYISDIRDYDPEIFIALQGVQKLVISAIGSTPSAAHFSVDEAVAFARQAGAHKTYLTHIGHDLEHEAMSRTLQPDIQMGYDGQEIDFRL